MTNKIVKIQWIDTSFVDDDLSIEDAIELKPQNMVTFGILIKDDDSSVNVASTICINERGKDSEYRCTVAIPKSNVISIAELVEHGT